ncbi:MAG: hypothetical protein J6K72_02360 [Clostridia bacterium]|nr:hypothetical protein [Clostridia bacterium]
MANIKMQYLVQRCPSCKKEVCRCPVGGEKLGPKIVKCKKCGLEMPTQLQVEWYEYKTKWLVFALPFLAAAMGFVVGLFMGEPAIGVMAAIFMALIGLVISGVNIVKMLLSKRRMKNREYLEKLVKYQLITEDEFQSFMQEI